MTTLYFFYIPQVWKGTEVSQNLTTKVHMVPFSCLMLPTKIPLITYNIGRWTYSTVTIVTLPFFSSANIYLRLNQQDTKLCKVKVPCNVRDTSGTLKCRYFHTHIRYAIPYKVIIMPWNGPLQKCIPLSTLNMCHCSGFWTANRKWEGLVGPRTQEINITCITAHSL